MRIEKKRPRRPTYTSLFLAIVPPREIQAITRDTNRTLVREARNFNFVPLERLHLTVKFLGEHVSDSSIAIITERMQEVLPKFSAFTLSLGKLRFGLQSQNIPHVLFWEIASEQILEDLSSALHYEIKSLGLADVKKEKDFYRDIYHITTARVRHKVSRSFGRRIRDFLETQKYPEIIFPVNEISLMRTKYNFKEITYEILAKFQLQPKIS